jgi:hypothetical protein
MANCFELALDSVRNNNRISHFYLNNPHISLEQVNIFIVDMLEQLQLSSENTNSMTIMKRLNEINDKLTSNQSDINKMLATKFDNYKKEYMESLKLILLSNNQEQISPLVKEQTAMLVDKTSLLLKDLFPKNCEVITKNIERNLEQTRQSLLSETTKMLVSAPKLENLGNEIKNSFRNNDDHVNSLINSFELRLNQAFDNTNKQIQLLHQTTNETNNANNNIQQNLDNLLKKFMRSNSSSKGQISENAMYNILLSLYSKADIENVAAQKESGDLMFTLDNTKIIIENKEYESKNVSQQEVTKFIRDCEVNNCSGILFSQRKGIANKDDFELQIHNSCVLLYVTEVAFDPTKIKMAVDVVVQFKKKLDEIVFTQNNTNTVIDLSLLDLIRKDTIAHYARRTNMVQLLKSFNEKMNYELNEDILPNLDLYLESRYAQNTQKQEPTICKYCGVLIKKSISQHFRWCKKNKEGNTIQVPSELPIDSASDSSNNETNNFIISLTTLKPDNN